MDLVKRPSRPRRALHFALLALLALSLSIFAGSSCTAVLGIDTSYGDNSCITGVDDAGAKLQPLVCGMGACLKLLPSCDDNQLPNVCPDAGGAEEKCNGIDDNCDGIVDEGCACQAGQEQPCYRGSVETRNTGICHDGKQTCQNGVWSECVGDVLPVPEVCDQRDNDCNGKVDDGPECGCAAGQKQPCYTGPDGTLDHPMTAPCKQGTQSCGPDGHWGDCVGSVAPAPEICDGIDNNCNGVVDEGCPCMTNVNVDCYTGTPANTEGVGICHKGIQVCTNGQITGCMGEQTPKPEQCNGLDDDCNGKVDDGDFGVGMPCNVAGLQGPCALGEKACGPNGLYCKQTVFPTTETCNGIDDDCDGTVDNGNPGGGGFCTLSDPAIKGECVNGVNKCEGGHIVCAQNYTPVIETCNGKDDDCNGKIDDGPFCCPNLIKDGNETDVDCGGSCVPCAANLKCVQDVDCQSLICKMNICQPAACNDFVKNGLETDIDCGGPICLARCNVGQTCKTPGDCTSNVCVSNVCVIPKCSDGVKNGNETDVDCGGPSCAPCAGGLACLVNADCASSICAGGICKGATCTDSVQNGTETDIDCGGSCVACDINKKCKVGTDCKSAVCSGSLCQAPTCSDGVQNGNESDVDCGGPCPLKCGIGYKCNTGSDCTSGVCNNNFCAQKPLGALCQAASECSSGNCIDGVCCNTACGGVCQACTAAKKGAGNDGICGPISAGADPDAECADQGSASCGTDGFCDGAGACRVYPIGTTCGAAACQADGITLKNASTCNGLGACISGGTTNCSPSTCANAVCVTACTMDSQCASTAYCNGSACVARKVDGSMCGAGKECLSGNCIDGVCCNLPCAGPCQACTATKKGSGADGICGNIAAGADPDNECSFQNQSTCGTTGFCDGFGKCQLYAGGATCAPVSCAGTSTLDKGKQCDGNGNCVANGTQSCGNYVCSGAACLTSCTTSADCVSTAYCSGSVCLSKKGLGAACAAAVECGSGACADGVCCDSACTGVCQACTGMLKGYGLDGSCQPILTGTDPDNECSDQGAASCGTTGVCNGSGACQKYAAGVQCVAQACAADGVTLNKPRQCDGAGTCAAGTTQSCAPYVCVGAACLTSCTGPTDCAPGFSCSGGICTAACTSDAQCGGSAYCNGVICLTKKPTGTACGSAHECSSGFCVDGVCCDTACNGTCQACTATLKSGGADGTCGPIAAGADPQGECADQGATSCGTNGACNGAGACQKYAAGTACGAASCSGTVLTNANFCNGTGSCSNNGTTNCAPYACVGAACNTFCTLDTDCAPGAYCNGAQCKAKLANGAACTGNNACGSGFCVDGVCCATACTGFCQACSNAKKGGGGDGVCGAVAAGTDPDAECADQGAASCGTNGFCDGAGACQKYAVGTVCAMGSCAADGVTLTAASTCNSTGSCVAGATSSCAPFACVAGACTNGSPCTMDSQCAPTAYCNGSTCIAKKSQSSPCVLDHECTTGHCADGVCCDTACAGQCQACTATKKGAAPDGTCGSIKAGTDPDGECADQGAASCGTNGVCNGAGACQLYTAGTVCTLASCSGSSAVLAKSCDGLGNCLSNGSVACSPYACLNGNCLTSCTSNAQCLTGFYCTSSSGGTCQPLKGQGATCGAPSECASGFCVDNFCCDQVCSGGCQACSNALTTKPSGTCAPISAGQPAKSGCATTAASTCGTDGNCNGAGNCEDWPASTQCSAKSCTGTTQTNAANCTGAGACATATTTSCLPYVCGATACKTSCTADADCATGNWCMMSACVPKSSAGATCGGGNECTSGNCVDSVCCGSASCLSCQTCNGTTPGTCTNIASSQPDNNPAGTCTGNKACDGSGTCKLTLGAVTCTQDSDCLSTHCVDGACCGVGSCPTCQTCNGTTPGTCTNIASGQPDNNPAGACVPTCSAGSSTPNACDGNGNCVAGTATSCSPYLCNTGTGTCSSSCTPTSQCVSSYQCVGGDCLTAISQSCTANKDCATNRCNGSPSTCQVCTAASNCGGGSNACNTSVLGGVCVSVAGTACTSDVQCQSNHCAGTCTACSGTSPCPTGSTCTSGVCVGPAGAGCSQNGHCSSGACGSLGFCLGASATMCSANALCSSNLCSGGACAACTSSTQCATGGTCTSGVCKNLAGVACYSNSQCSSGNCSTSTGLCL
jgi:hypothetical protein